MEQRYNILRCVEAGNARLVTRRAAARTSWPQLVAEVMGDEGMARSAERMTGLMRRLDGPAEAADAIRQVARQRAR